MRNALAILAVFCTAHILSSCNNSNSPSAAPPAEQPAKKASPTEEAHATLNWSLKLESKCQDVAEEENCLANYGFTVLTDGHYLAGPGPHGESKSGTLTAEELSSVTSALTPVLSLTQFDAPQHESLEEGASNSNDTLTLMRSTNTRDVLVKTEGTELNFQTPSSKDAKLLLATMRQLAATYYSLPFPESTACTNAASALQTLFASMQTCKEDKDCAFVDSTFETLDPASSEFLTTDNCTVIKPLVVANASMVKSNQSKLMEGQNQVAEVCGTSLKRPNCTSIAGFTLSGQPPVCKQGVCQAPASATVTNPAPASLLGPDRFAGHPAVAPVAPVAAADPMHPAVPVAPAHPAAPADGNHGAGPAH